MRWICSNFPHSESSLTLVCIREQTFQDVELIMPSSLLSFWGHLSQLHLIHYQITFAWLLVSFPVSDSWLPFALVSCLSCSFLYFGLFLNLIYFTPTVVSAWCLWDSIWCLWHCISLFFLLSRLQLYNLLNFFFPFSDSFFVCLWKTTEHLHVCRCTFFKLSLVVWAWVFP